MVIIKCNSMLKAAEHDWMWRRLVNMSKSGVILLPPGFELLNEVPADADIVVVKEGPTCRS